MITQTSAVAFRQNLGEMLNQVQYRHDSVSSTRTASPWPRWWEARLFERIRRMQERFDGLCRRIESSFEGAPEAEVKEIEAAVALERAGQRKLARMR